MMIHLLVKQKDRRYPNFTFGQDDFADVFVVVWIPHQIWVSPNLFEYKSNDVYSLQGGASH